MTPPPDSLATRLPRLLSPDEAAAYLGARKATLYGWVYEKRVPYLKAGRLLRFDVAELREWMATGGTKEAACSLLERRGSGSMGPPK